MLHAVRGKFFGILLINTYANSTSSYSLALAPDGAPSSRPAFSATCYSNLPNATSVTAYDNVTITSTQPYSNPTAQVFALVIDGFVATTVANSIGSSAAAVSTVLASSSGTSVSSSDATASPAQAKSTSISGGAIAGAAIAAVAGIFLIVVASFLFSKRYRRGQQVVGEKAQVPELTDETSKTNLHEMDDEGRYWQDKVVKKVTEQTLELHGDDRPHY